MCVGDGCFKQESSRTDWTLGLGKAAQRAEVQPAVNAHTQGGLLHGSMEHQRHVSLTTNFYNKTAFNITPLRALS